MCLAFLNNSLVDERRSIKNCNLHSILVAPRRDSLHLDGFRLCTREKFIEKKSEARGKAIKNWFQESTGAESRNGFVMKIHKNRVKNKPRFPFPFLHERVEESLRGEKLICGWFNSQKTTEQKKRKFLCKNEFMQREIILCL